MSMEDLISRSPLRILENSIHGGLGKGNIGVLASRKGVGKTACLVHIATDKLFQRKPVIHVSYASRVDHIISWYEDVFRQLAAAGGTDPGAAAEFHDELVKNRVIMNFNQAGLKTEQALRSLEALIQDGKFRAETVIIDGFDFAAGSADDLARVKEFAGRMGVEVWFSVSLKGPEPLFDENGTPFELAGSLDRIDVLITLHDLKDRVQIRLVKDDGHPVTGDLGLSLDPTTLLIAE
jgi:hypothetical protein